MRIIRLMLYNWQQPDWPHFRYDLKSIEAELLTFSDRSGQISGMLRGLPQPDQTEAIIQIMISEALKTSEIEGEYLSRSDVMSSIRNQWGLNDPLERIRDRASEGAAELMVAIRDTWADPLDEAMLFSWHRMLMKGSHKIELGSWRTHEDSMQVISNPYGKQKVHFEAPPSSQVPAEMKLFIDWFNTSLKQIRHAPVRSAIAHLYFESIHPFADGNGRIGRAISEKALSQSLGRPAAISLSPAIEIKKNDYYDALENAQRSNEITAWIGYFLKMVLRAQKNTLQQVDFVLRKTRFFDQHGGQLNDRQLRIVERMLEDGPGGFEGGMNARKYVALTKISKATATRDLQDLAKKEIFIPIGSGRSARYELRL